MICAPSTSGTTRSHLVVSTTMEARLLSKSMKAISTIRSITAAGLTSVNGFSAQNRERESGLCRMQVVPKCGYHSAPTSCRMGDRHTITWTNSTAASISTTWLSTSRISLILYARDPYSECRKHVDESKEETPETVRHGATSVHHVPGRVPVDAAAQEPPTTSLVTVNVHSRPIPMNKCILTVNFAQQLPEDTNRLFSEPTILSQELLHWV